MEGFYLMHRGWMDDEDFKDDEISRREAWVWLIENGAYKPIIRTFEGSEFKLERGQLLVSERYLAEQWNWHPSKVNRFLQKMKKSGKISTHVEQRKTGAPKQPRGVVPKQPSNLRFTPRVTIITICNYDKYQDPRQPQKTAQKRPTETTLTPPTETLIEINNIYTKPQPITDRELRELIFDIIQAGHYPDIPKDAVLAKRWLQHGSADRIVEIVRHESEKLRRNTGQAPFTLKVIHDPVMAKLTEESRKREEKAEADRIWQQKIDRQNKEKAAREARDAQFEGQKMSKEALAAWAKELKESARRRQRAEYDNRFTEH